MEWQPIATAPRDTEVWVYGLAKVWSGSMRFWWQGQAGFDADEGNWMTTSYNDKGEPLLVTPTHWMPLPPPPPSLNIEGPTLAELADKGLPNPYGASD